MAEFSVSPTRKVYFSMGNLQYSTEGTHQCADGTTQPGTWRFAEKQWELGSSLEWGNSGYMVNYNTLKTDIAGTYYDWGVYNAIENGGNTPNVWRTLTKEEWNYVLNERQDASKLKRIFVVNDKTGGVLLFPDNWFENHVEDINEFPRHLYSASEMFRSIANSGGIYIPCGEVSISDSRFNLSECGVWTASFASMVSGYYRKYYLYIHLLESFGWYQESCKISETTGDDFVVRLVKDVE
jgi:hypothetical protein